MEILHEVIPQQSGLPIRVILHSLEGTNLHWHEMIELLLVLDGSIQLQIGDTAFEMHKDDIVLINSCMLHSTNAITQNNLLVALQIDQSFFAALTENKNTRFLQVNSALDTGENLDRYPRLRELVARVVKEMAEQQPGYHPRIGALLYKAAEHLQLNFSAQDARMAQCSVEQVDYQRLLRIVLYVRQNLGNKLTLSDLCREEHLSYHYLSHFIKDKLGLSFQQYLNKERLEHASQLLRNSATSITEIAEQVGFASAAAFSRAFKQHFNTSPNAFRKDAIPDGGEGQPSGMDYPQDSALARSYRDVDRTNMLSGLYSYIPAEKAPQALPAQAVQTIGADAVSPGQPMGEMALHSTSFTHAAEGLYAHWQQQLDQLQKEVGFRYVRFHGIFSDRMMVVNRNLLTAELEYHWGYIDQLLDALLAKGLRPFVELGFMPQAMASGQPLPLMWWQPNTSPPTHLQEWTALVQAFIRHAINRYGLDEVRQWYFEVWNEPEMPTFWQGAQQAYFEFYTATSGAIKHIDAQLRVGGPSIAHQELADSTYLEDFIAHCIQHELLPDFITIHIYPEYYPRTPQAMGQYLSLIADESLTVPQKMMQASTLQKIYYGRDHTADMLRSANQRIKAATGQHLALHVTEWSSSAQNGNLVHDTAFEAAFLVHHVIASRGLAQSLAYWTFTDINEEAFMQPLPFHGGFGLINREGIPKASFYAYQLISRLGDTVLDSGDGWIITRRGNALQVLVCNYAYFSQRFIKGDVSLLQPTDRYEVFEQKPNLVLDVSLAGLKGCYRITRSSLNREHGSAYDQWVKMGAPQALTPQDVSHLRRISRPAVKVEHAQLDGCYNAHINLPAHAVELLELTPEI